jgi:hypothetical protein
MSIRGRVGRRVLLGSTRSRNHTAALDSGRGHHAASGADVQEMAWAGVALREGNSIHVERLGRWKASRVPRGIHSK